MKKWQQTGKKALSVFMAIMMLMTAWVWVAPTEASAANGSYYYKLEIIVTDTAEGWNTNNVYLYHRANNGRASGTTSIKINMSNANWNEGKTHTFTGGPISGFPCGYTHQYSFGGGVLTWRTLGYDIKLYVSSNGSSYTQIYSNSYYDESSPLNEAAGTFGGSTCVGADKYPYVSTSKSISSATAVADIGIPPLGDEKDTSISERSIQYYTTDQYGVRYEPTSYTVSGVAGLTTPTSWSMGNAYKISATQNTTKSTTATYQTATAKLNWTNSNSNQTQHADSSYTFKVYNPRYKFTFNGNGGNLGTNYTYAYHGRTLGDSTSTATSNNVAGLSAEKVPTAGIKEGYTFKGIYTSATGGTQITSSTVANVTADQTYYAQWDVNKYTATFYGTKANDTGSGTVEYVIQTSNVDYGNNPVAPSTVDGYSLGDYDYTFDGWDKEISPIGINGAEYRARYTSAFVPANYTEVDEIVAEANAIINGANYEAIYSEESRNALENAVNSVIYNQGRTSQAVVDSYVPMIREAIDGLGRQKYSVLFIDAVDNSVISMSYPVYYGDPVKFPADPVRGFTTTDHYVFKGWESSESGDDITFVSKNMVILANFDKVAHTFTDTPLSSNCTTQSGVLHKCSCGYEYVEYSGSVGTEHDLDSEFTIDIAPTCTTVGSKSRHCSRCTYRADVTEIPALGHDYTDGYQGVVINPGCENDGAEVSECQRCGYDKYTIVPAIGHNWSEEVIAPTCTSSGYTVKTCSNCHDEDIVSFVDPVAHTYTEATDEYIAPTCTGLGKKVYYCSCGAQKVETVTATGHVWETELTTDYDATCTTEGQQSVHCSVCDVINADSITVIPENGHIWGEEVCEQKESCGVKGLYVKTCEVCQENSSRIVDALTHKYITETTPATCTEGGKEVTVCEICGDIKSVEFINPTGHKYNNEGAIIKTDATCDNMAYNTYKCDVCGETKKEYIDGSAALMHDFTGTETVVTPATCTTDGEKTVKCSRCDAQTTVIIPHLGHTWGDWTVTKEATNTTPGEMTRTCSNGTCSETVEIPAGGHEFDNGTVTKAATCSEEGTMVYKCTAHENCGITLEVTIPVEQHTVAQKVVEATCTASGSVEAYCSACNKSFDIKPTPAKAHNPVVKETVAPTCTTSGYTVYACDCGTFSYNEYDASKPATGHISWTETDREDATCTKDGYIKYECSVCKAPKEEILPKTGHSFTENKAKATAATCTALATKTYECACGASYVEYYGELAAHNYNTLVKTVPATNDSLGYEEYKCDCGLTKITILEATGTHVFIEKIADECVAPTCTENGTDVYKCSAHDNCGVKSSVLVPRLGHTVEAVYKAPTCKAEGSSAACCVTCDTVVDSVAIPATGIHNWNEGVETTAPTCEGEGVKTYTCSVCSETKTAAIPAKGHDLSTTVVDATCEANGTVVITCSRCDDTDVEKTINLTKKNHDWNKGEETTAPTCEEEGVKTYTCSLCGAEKTGAIPAKGHSWNDWSVTPSTNSAKGSVSRSCQICGAKETVDIPEGNHSLVVDTDKSSDASCKAEGKLVYKCENHADCGITVTVITAKLQHKSETKTVTEADCVTNGKVETRCTECGTLLVETTIPAKGHAYNNVSVKDATCTEDGVRTYTCACGDSRTEAIPAKGHSYKTTVTPATCTAPGSVVTECTVCHSDEAKTVTALPVMGHDYTGVETLIKSADCETDGSKTVQCSRCDVTTTVILPKLGHSYSDWVKIDATNDKDGTWSRECSTCGKEETLTIPAGGHNLVETENVPSKCNKKGHITYKCNAHENCSVTVTVELDYAQHTILKDNADATCTDNGHSITYCQECGVKFNDFEIPAKGHSYEGQTTLPATCIKEGVMTYTCSKCNDSYTVSVPMTQHTYEAGEEVKATCTTRGYIPYSCTTSGCTSGYEVLTEEAKGHTYKQTVSSSTCTKDGKVTLECECGDTIEADVPALGHAYVLSATTAADCTAAATETYTCSRCDASYTVSVGDKAEHTFSEWKIIAEATENTLGYKTRSCTKCGKIELEKIDAIGDHKFDKFISETPATCTDPGETVYGCSTHDDCGLTSTVVIPAHGHDMEETAAAVVPTCDSDGTTAVFTCKNRCGKVEGGEKIAALGHIYGEGEVTPATCEDEGKIVYTCGRCGGTHTAVIETNENAHQYETTVTDATCTKEGSVIAKCKLCGNETLNKTLPKLEHTWSVDKTTPATCDTDGTTYYKCSCGATNETAIPKLGHRMTAGLSVDATCTENGYTPYTCTNSGCTYTYNVYNAPAIAHNYVQVENSSTADCVNGGTVTLRCSECGKEITAAVPALGHDWGEWTTTKNPTAADEGEMERSCKRDGCNTTETVPLPALGHEMVKDEVNSTAATCTAEGTDVYVCKTHTDCGYTYSVKTAKLAHDYDEGTVTEKATCTTDGEKTYTCKCGATVTELIPKTAHTLSTAVTEATCQVQGSVVTSCADCEYEIKTDLGYGVHKLTVVRESDPDCETKGIITVKCSETGCTHIADTIELPATGHDWSGEESDIVPATCETDGSKKVKCLHCEETTTVVIPATGHNYAEGESFAATCITSGYTVFACDCGSSYSRLDSQPNGHSWDEGTVKTPADCVNEGIILVKCENCEASYEKTVSKLCHSWGAWVTTKYPTASEEGEMTRACIRGGCDATETAVIPALGGGNVTYTVTFVADGEVVAVQNVNHGSDATAPVISKASDANGHYSYIWDTDFTNVTDNLTVTAIFTLAGHTYGSWVTDRESTCQANGSQHRSCTVCGYTETASLTLADHNYSVVVGEKAPTCTENGYKDVVCSVCGKAEKQTVKRLGHIMTYHERVYETCDSEGLLAHFSCSRCGKNFEDRQGNFELSKVVVNKMYHSFVIVEGFAPTCTSDGATTYKHCTVCGMTEVSVPIPALGHVDANGDHYCDRCSSAYMDGGEIVCTCNCHKVGFFNELIYKILRFFWQLFGKNKTCTCGAIHY